MTDPLSVTASIVALLDFGTKVLGYLNDVKNGSEDRGKVLSEIVSVNRMLYSLQEKAHEDKQNNAWCSTFQSLNVPKGPLDQIRTALESLSTKLAPPSTSLKKVRKAMTWPFQKGEIKEILERIDRAKGLLNMALQNDHIKLSKDIKKEVEEVAKGVSRIQMSQITSEHLKMMQWLDAPDPWTNYNRALKDRNPNTGSWFLESSIYAEWKATRGSFLWLHGIPGCGKTILSSTILQNVLNQYSEKSNSAVLFFYFDFNASEKQRHENMIHSLICQLSKHCEISVLQNLYSSCSNGGRQPSGEVLQSTLHQMMTSLADTYIVFDALDECEDRHELLTNLEQIVSWEHVNLHVLVTSRRETDIDEVLTPLTHSQNRISIQSKLVNADIRTYIHDRLQVDRKLKRWQKDLNIQREIEGALMRKAGGMFRWVACQLDLLGSCFSVRHLRQALASLPETLDDTYARILLNIDKQYNHYYREVLKILQWLSFSARPLQLKELAEIVAIDIDETPRFDPERRWPEPQDILTICSSLVTTTTYFVDTTVGESNSQYTKEGHDTELDADSPEYDTDSMVEASDYEVSTIFVRLAHFSVKEYLVSERIQTGIAARYSTREIESHGVIAGDCITYFLQFDKPDSLTPETLELSPLSRYAAENWTHHARQAQKGSVETTAYLSMELLMSGEGGLLNWVRIANPDEDVQMDLRSGNESLASPLYYASLVGLSEPVNKMIENNLDVNAQGGWYGNALQAASILGCTGIAQALLDNGAHIDATGRYGTALCAFCHAGNYEIVELLLDQGANIDAYGEGDFDCGTPLQNASEGGYENIVKLLLDRGAGVNATSALNVESSLEMASLQGHEAIVKSLLDKGADVNAQRHEYSALKCASRQGYKNIVKMLLDKGADVDTQGEKMSALQSASKRGFEDVVKMLLDKGADANARGAEGTALQLASEGSHENVVKMLLDKGADTNAQSYRSSALQSASLNGHENIVKMLLEKGADINDQGGIYGSALQCASRNGYENIVKMLLEKGADINDQGGIYGSALQCASEWGHENVVKMLLDRGADINNQGGIYGSALQCASWGGHENVVKMLLEKGAVWSEGESEIWKEEMEASEEGVEISEGGSEDEEEGIGDSESEQDADPLEPDVQDPESSTTPAVAN